MLPEFIMITALVPPYMWYPNLLWLSVAKWSLKPNRMLMHCQLDPKTHTLIQFCLKFKSLNSTCSIPFVNDVYIMVTILFTPPCVNLFSEHIREICQLTAVIDCTHSETLTHWGWDKMADISQTTFSNAFSWMQTHRIRLIFHGSLFLRSN